MTQIASPARAERIEVDHAARTRLADADYADAFRIAVAEFHPAEELARQAMESAPLPLRAIVPTAWRRVLVLRLGPLHGSSAHVLGGASSRTNRMCWSWPRPAR